MDLYGALRPLIFRLDPETAHNLAFWLGERTCAWPRLSSPEHPAALRRSVLGLDFPTPLGLAAGFRAHGVLVNRQTFTKTAHIWGVGNNAQGTNSNRVVLFEKA